MLTNLTPQKVVAVMAFALNFFNLFGLGEYPEQINNAEEMIASLAVIDMDSWSLTMLTFFENAMYVLMSVYLAAYVLIFFGFRMGKWLLIFSYLLAIPVSLVMGGIVTTVAEEHLSNVISMLDGCLIYLLFLSKKMSR